ncbi:MAG: prolipoprotein diacylglyceryl transferase [Gorillibacterium sp.]|nr:prolipoprotein diacylglyceryl transferase [Gorillibacterium sp.]
MRVILFTIGDYSVHTYGLVVALAMLLAMGMGLFLTKGTPYQKHISNMMLYLIAGAFLGARVWHVFFFQWDYYASHLTQIPSFWNGGLAIQGGLVGGFLAAAIYTRRHKLSFWALADIMAPAIVLGQGIGRIACFLNGDAFGSPTGSGFGIVYPPGTMAYDTYGSQPLWPAEVWEGQWDIIVFVLLILMKSRKWPKGCLFLAYNILYSLGRFMLEFLRGDSPRYALDWTAGQWTSITVIAISLLLALVFVIRERSGGSEPGRHIEEGESSVDSTTREVKEETGLSISDLELCGIIFWYNDVTGDKYFVFSYRTDVFSGELLDKTDEGSLLWVDKNELPSLFLADGLKERLPMFFDKKYSEGFDIWNENNLGELKWQ